MRAEARKILILGGTAEARQLAVRGTEALPADVDIISSYAGRTRRPTDPPGTVREGGFGGADGLAAYLDGEAITLVVDATHPFAANISRHAALACARIGVPRLMLTRPAWRMPNGAQWTAVGDMNGAGEALTSPARRVFLSTGSQGIEAFANRPDLWFLVRLIAAPETPPPLVHHAVVTGRPPYGLAAERDLMAAHDIDTLVSKASGGPLPAKITAAAEQGIPIILVEPPPPPDGEQAGTIDAALSWIVERL